MNPIFFIRTKPILNKFSAQVPSHNCLGFMGFLVAKPPPKARNTVLPPCRAQATQTVVLAPLVSTGRVKPALNEGTKSPTTGRVQLDFLCKSPL